MVRARLEGQPHSQVDAVTSAASDAVMLRIKGTARRGQDDVAV